MMSDPAAAAAGAAPAAGQAAGQAALPSTPAQAISGNAQANNSEYMGLLAQSTAQTLQIQLALLNHNLTVGPAMAAKSASDDAKKT
jgi:hypothetical protein